MAKQITIKLAMVETIDYSLGGNWPRLLCEPCASDAGIETNTTLDEIISNGAEEVRCDECDDLLWDMDDGSYSNYWDPDDDQAPDSDPYDVDRDEYEPGGRYFDRDEPAERFCCPSCRRLS